MFQNKNPQIIQSNDKHLGMKNKSNGKFRARLNAIGYKKFIESPVTSQQFLLQ